MLAGCTQVSTRDFEAEPVWIPPEVAEEYGLELTEDETVTYEEDLTIDEEDIRVVLRSQLAVYEGSGATFTGEQASFIHRFLGTDGGIIWVGDSIEDGSVDLLPGPVPFLQGDAPLDPRRLAVLAPEEAIGMEAIGIEPLPHESDLGPAFPMGIFHRSALDGDLGNGEQTPGKWSEWDERIEFPLPDGETSIELPANRDYDESFTIGQNGIVITGRDFLEPDPAVNMLFNWISGDEVQSIDPEDVRVALIPPAGTDDLLEEFDFENPHQVTAGDHVDADFIMAPTNVLFDLEVEVTDPDRFEQFVPIEEYEIPSGSISGPVGVTVFVDEENETIAPMAYIPADELAPDPVGNANTPTRDGIIVYGDDSFVPRVGPNFTLAANLRNRASLFFPDNPERFAESAEDARIISAGEEISAEEVNIMFPTGSNPLNVADVPGDLGPMPAAFSSGETVWDRAYEDGAPTTMQLSAYPFFEAETSAVIAGYGNLGRFEATSMITLAGRATISPDVAESAEQRWSPGVPDYDEGVGVFATPKAEIDGELLNPIADMSTSSLFTDAEAQAFMPTTDRFIPPIGEPDATRDPRSNWLRGPEAVRSTETTLIGLDGVLESYVGVTGSRDDPESAFVHMARVESDDDIIITSVVQRMSVDAVDGPWFGDDGVTREDILETSVGIASELSETFIAARGGPSIGS